MADNRSHKLGGGGRRLHIAYRQMPRVKASLRQVSRIKIEVAQRTNCESSLDLQGRTKVAIDIKIDDICRACASQRTLATNSR